MVFRKVYRLAALWIVCLLACEEGFGQCELTDLGLASGSGTFGSALSASPEVVVAGDPSAGEEAVYFFARDRLSWSLLTEMRPTDSGSDASAFGSAIAHRASLILVGAPTHSGSLSQPSRGAVYVAKLFETQPGDPFFPPSANSGDQFGTSVALGDDYWAAGSPGADGNSGSVSAFTLVDSRFAQTLYPSDPQPWSRFGASLAAQGAVLAVGAPGADSFQGAVYVFERAGSNWILRKKLSAPDGQPGDQLGASVALQVVGTRVRVFAGAPGFEVASIADAGRVVMFESTGLGWSSEALESPLPVVDGGFGASVAIDQDLMLVGSPGVRDYEGAGFVYSGISDEWTRVDLRTTVKGRAGEFSEAGAQLALSDGIAWLGARLAVGGGRVSGTIVGGRDCDENGRLDRCEVLSGQVQDLNENNVPDSCELFVRGDVDGDGVTTSADAVALLNSDWIPGSATIRCSAAADANTDGMIDLSDAIRILSVLFQPGVPSLAAPWPDCGLGFASELSCDTPSVCP